MRIFLIIVVNKKNANNCHFFSHGKIDALIVIVEINRNRIYTRFFLYSYLTKARRNNELHKKKRNKDKTKR